MSHELDVDALAQEIRRVDGKHDLGAGQLAEALMPFLIARSHPPTDAGVSGSVIAAFYALRDLANRIDADGTASQIGSAEEIREIAGALRAALSTAIPAGDGVPPGMAKSALDCVVHALMVLPVPIDGQGKRAWASLLEAQTILEGLSTASTAGKG